MQPSRTVLAFVEDPWLRRTVQEILERTGFRTLVTGDAGRALEALSGTPGLAIVANNWDRSEAPSLLEHIRAHHPGLPLLCIGPPFAPPCPADQHLPTPFHPADLLGRVRSQLPRA